MNINKHAKLQNDYDFMKEMYVSQKKTPKQIAELLNISKRLVDIKIKEHGLIV